MTFFMAGEGRRQYGQTVPSELRDKFAMSIRQPLGVCAVITPWNFPMAIPSWKIVPALVCGNTVVFKPATLTPLSALNFVKILEEAGMPPRRRQPGDRRRRATSATRCSSATTVRVVSFTGSTAVGPHGRREQRRRRSRRSHLEMGGKNVIIVMDDANLELAVEGCLWGGFGTTGQRCTAASRVVVHERVYRDVSRSLRRARPGAAGRRRPRPGDRDGAVGQRGAARDGDAATSRSASKEGATAGLRRPSPDRRRARERLLPRADDLRRRRRRRCGSRRKRSSARSCR